MIGSYNVTEGWHLQDKVFPNVQYGFNGRHFIVTTLIIVSMLLNRNINTNISNIYSCILSPMNAGASFFHSVSLIVAVSCGYDTWFAVRLVMDYTISHGQFWDTLRIPHDQVSPSQTHRCPGACGSRQSDHVIIFDLPYPAYGYTWAVLWLLFFRSAPSTFPATWSTFKGPFRRVPSR